jgi:hypothetical protein
MSSSDVIEEIVTNREPIWESDSGTGAGRASSWAG